MAVAHTGAHFWRMRCSDLDYALLCDSAQVSQGKTFILGGGATILWGSSSPHLGFSLVPPAQVSPPEAETDQQLRFQVIDAET